MKILMVIPAVGPVYGGTSITVVELSQALGSCGVQVDIVTTNANGRDTLAIPLKVWDEQKFYRIQYFPYWRQAKEYKLSWSLTQWLFQHVSEYDVVHTNALFCYPNLITYLACLYHQIPYIVVPHGMLEPWALSHKAHRKLWYYYVIEKPALNRASAIQMLATPELENIKPLQLRATTFTLPNGIHRSDFEQLPDVEIFYQRFPETRGKRVVLFLGRIDPKKGLDLLGPAFARIHKQFSDTHLVVAGPDNIGFLPTALSYFVAAGCQNAVTFTGMLSGELKYAALAAATIYVAPSYSEGFSMSVLEGMASGLPCVITTGCNFPEAGKAGAAHIVEISADAIANALRTCLQKPCAAKAMGERACQFVFAHYTWDQIAARLIKVYEAILAQTPLPIFAERVAG